MEFLASQSTAVWFGNWNSDVHQDARNVMKEAASQGATAVLVAYNIPSRDCGGYSKGGADSLEHYRQWIRSLAAGIGSGDAVVILEPDALASMTCLSQSDQDARVALLAEAVESLKRHPGTRVYLDGGHAGWVEAGEMARRLQEANIDRADGFALNVSNFQSTETSEEYGARISSALGGKHFIIDTSRNGAGPSKSNEWCNPPDRQVGESPTTATHSPLSDAYLWIKTPGESDGACNGGPAAGVWWPEYALELTEDVR
jgi:endoglucanase